jgi:hypothetical protein
LPGLRLNFKSVSSFYLSVKGRHEEFLADFKTDKPGALMDRWFHTIVPIRNKKVVTIRDDLGDVLNLADVVSLAVYEYDAPALENSVSLVLFSSYDGWLIGAGTQLYANVEGRSIMQNYFFNVKM